MTRPKLSDLSWRVPDALRVQFEQLRPVLDQIDRENRRLKPLLDQIARERAALSAVPQPAPALSVKGKSGPKKDSVKYGPQDAALAPEMDTLIAAGESPHGAALKLACAGRVAGGGTAESRAKRLASRYASNGLKPRQQRTETN